MRSSFTATRVLVAALAIIAIAACGGEPAGEPPDVQFAPEAVPPGPTLAAPEINAPLAQGPGEIGVQLTEWDLAVSRDTVDAGTITFRVRNAGSLPHAFEVEGNGLERETEPLQPGATAALTVELAPGRYTLYCPVVADVNHRTEGMVTTLLVREAAGAP